ncbi:hypothetical protein HNR09_002759 [Nesterenkonia xinjiangensis]|uniref:Uncharacterized protein n=1 Tax=Nesterenkonia xinjiangensis TaxID=225327 RepID=A0A7Z0GQP5_9MICC|nr:hypothetical protein [Nesterenkonia xinjiangensis]
MNAVRQITVARGVSAKVSHGSPIALGSPPHGTPQPI